MFFVLFGALAVILTVIFCFGIYILAAYVFSRLGEKFQVGSFLAFLVPIYNIMLLCDCAKITRWVTLGLAAPGLVVFGARMFFPYPSLGAGVYIVSLCANIYLWGSIAERLGKNFWLWGIATPVLFGLPVLVLAFDDSMPVDRPQSQPESSESQTEETKYIDI